MDKVEALARRMCEAYHREPDRRVTNLELELADTPNGRVKVLPPVCATLAMWQCYVPVAQVALDATEEMPQLVQATYYKDVVRVALALSSRDASEGGFTIGGLVGAIMSALKGMSDPVRLREEIVKQCEERDRGDKPARSA